MKILVSNIGFHGKTVFFQRLILAKNLKKQIIKKILFVNNKKNGKSAFFR